MDEKIPELTLQQTKTTEPIPALSGPDLSQLSVSEQKAVAEFSEKIDLTDSQQVLQYGASAQRNIADFSETALESVRSKDMGEIGSVISDLVLELKGFSPGKQKGILGLFQKAGTSLAAFKNKYEKASTHVNNIIAQLEGHQVKLMKDVSILDQMYDKNLEHFKSLTMYILAGRTRLSKERETTLQKFKQKAQTSGLSEDAQAYHDFANLCDRFDKKLHDLELTRVVSLQMAPQIRMLQNNDTVMTEKIQSSLMNTIPLWKSQMVLALGIGHAQEALAAQRAVTDATNELLYKNSELLKQATVGTAHEAERGVVDLETLRHTNETLISTLDEVLRIQTEGAEKRRMAETELARIEGELKKKLLSVQE